MRQKGERQQHLRLCWHGSSLKWAIVITGVYKIYKIVHIKYLMQRGPSPAGTLPLPLGP